MARDLCRLSTVWGIGSRRYPRGLVPRPGTQQVRLSHKPLGRLPRQAWRALQGVASTCSAGPSGLPVAPLLSLIYVLWCVLDYTLYMMTVVHMHTIDERVSVQ